MHLDTGRQTTPAPKLAVCNYIPEIDALRAFAFEHGFDGVDWSFAISGLPETPGQESRLAAEIRRLAPLEVRYHCPFLQIDIGHEDPAQQKAAVELFRRIIRMVSKAGGRYLTLHVGLGHDTTRLLSWESTIDNLRRLVQYARNYGVRLCLENLAWGWTSKPNLFEKLIRRSGAGMTFDIGHARACDSVRSQQFAAEDFISPHADRLHNAHIYHTEREGVGHVPPATTQDIAERLDLLLQTPCRWWVLEIRETEGLLATKAIIDDYLQAAGILRQPLTERHS